MSIATPDLIALVGAIILAAIGGEAFLKGVLGVSGWLRVPKLLVATTLAAFATSSPELTVSSVAALAGKPEIGLGDALGSNVVNIALILGMALLFGGIRLARGELARDFALALAVPIVTLIMAFDGVIERWEGGLLLAAFVVWMAFFVVRAGRAARETGDPAADTGHHVRAVLLGCIGLAALIASGRLFVEGASGIASASGVHPYIVGAVVVAIGTSLPEFVTMLVARLRGHDEVGVGTLLGSNLFNGLAVIGTAAAIHPIRAPLEEIAIATGFGILAVLLMWPGRSGAIGRGRGILLLAVYAAFVWTTLAAGSPAFLE
ncbi:MAG: sodium:calcium antiporter [Sulfuricellaceae bacterium]|nr:sodium:calcium antiporter [Sulfuricellaceae bacterium]